MNYQEAIEKHFPNALKGKELTEKVNELLEEEGFTPENTVFSNSTCPDEINREVTEFGDYWGENFPLGGLAGIPFTGKTGFGAYSHHVPDDGNLFIVYGSHVGVTDDGRLGKIKRKGMSRETASCGSAVGAYTALLENPELSMDSNDDEQQAKVNEMVRKFLPQLKNSDSPMADLPLMVYDIIHEKMDRIIPNSYNGKIARLGGVQINTPGEEPSYFLVRNFDIINPAENYRKEINIEEL